MPRRFQPISDDNRSAATGSERREHGFGSGPHPFRQRSSSLGLGFGAIPRGKVFAERRRARNRGVPQFGPANPWQPDVLTGA